MSYPMRRDRGAVARAALNYWIGLLCSSGCLGPGFLGEYAPKLLCDSSRLLLGDEQFTPDFSVGLEGGVQSIGNELECFAWIVVFNGSFLGYARTASFRLPSVITNLVVNEGMELGDADDKVFSTVNSKQKGGTIGKLTRGVIDRAKYYETAVVLAMIPFLWPELYSDSGDKSS